jgi:uncharacterized DUF497 family protein
MAQTDFEWDAARALTGRDPDAAGEERFISVGKDTLRGDLVRVISARRVSRSEQRCYTEKS